MQPLLDYFKNRSVWIVDADDRRPQLQRYTSYEQLVARTVGYKPQEP
jgi:hypothetical protein